MNNRSAAKIVAMGIGLLFVLLFALVDMPDVVRSALFVASQVWFAVSFVLNAVEKNHG